MVAQLFCQRGQALRLKTSERKTSAAGREHARRLCAYAARRARDEHDLAGNVVSHNTSS
jgi:hypothetical protein